MEIKIVTVKEDGIPEFTKPVLVISQSTSVTLEKIFTKFLQMQVGDGAASLDTVRSYLSQTKQYLDWCQDNLLPPLEADAEDIKQYRQYLALLNK